MGAIETSNVIAGSGLGTPLRKAGAPAAAANEVQTITGTATGGSGTFTFRGQATPAQSFNVSAANLQTVLRALSSVGGANVTCAGGPLGTSPITVTFSGALAGLSQPLITVGAGFTGGTVTVGRTTPGAPADGTGAPKGSLLTDTTNGVLYINTGTNTAPTWTKVGTQT